jgi:TonB family protein
MSRSTWRVAVATLLLGFTGIGSAGAQELSLQPVLRESSIARVGWPLMDLLLLPDTCYGILILAGPNVRAENWEHGSQIVSFSVDPVAVLQWGTAAEALLREPATNEKSDTLRYKATPKLQGHSGGFVILVKTLSRAPEDRRLQFIASDTTTHIQWKTFATAEDVTRLLATIHGSVARAPAPSPATDSTLVFGDDPGVVGVVQTQVPRLHYPDVLARQGVSGRVWAQYTVTADGGVEPGSIRILLSDHEDFAEAAMAALAQARFRPATRHGLPVRQRVFQAVNFRSR